MITPQQIDQIAFKKSSFGGYNMQQVDEFLEPLTEDYVTLYKENALLKSKLRVLAGKLEEYRKSEGAAKANTADAQAERDRATIQANQELADFAKEFAGWKVKTVLLRGHPGPEIVQYARDHGYDTLVMTRSSRGPLQKLGSVATYIVRNAQFLDLIVMREDVV